VLGTAHPTGYPAYVILGFIATHLLPFGDPAYRMNLLQAILAAGAVAGTVAVIQLLTGMRWIALAAGPPAPDHAHVSPATVAFPIGTVSSSPVFWRLSTYADPHMFHLALVALIFLLLLVWERRRSADPEGTPPRRPLARGRRRRLRRRLRQPLADPDARPGHRPVRAGRGAVDRPAVALDPDCAAVLVATVVVLFLELPIRAAMHAPQVYAHPDTWSTASCTWSWASSSAASRRPSAPTSGSSTRS
jgi:hypothetical protein